MSEALFYRIALTQGALESGANFFVRGIPRPDFVSFTDHAQRFPQGLGGESRQGFAAVTLLWLQLNMEGAGAIRAMVEAAEAISSQGAGVLYMTVPRNDAKHIGVSWIDISGIAILPTFTPMQQAVFVYENVQLRLNAVQILATPSTVMS